MAETDEEYELLNKVYSVQVNNRPCYIAVKFKEYNEMLEDILVQRKQLEKLKNNARFTNLDIKKEAILEQRRRLYDAYINSRPLAKKYLENIELGKEQLKELFEQCYKVSKDEFDDKIGVLQINDESFKVLFALFELELFDYNEKPNSALLCSNYRKYRADQLRKLEFKIADRLMKAYNEDFDLNGNVTDSYMLPKDGVKVIELDKIQPFIAKISKLNKAKGKQMSAMSKKVQELKLLYMNANKDEREKINKKLNNLVEEYVENDEKYFVLSQLDFLNENINQRSRAGKRGFKTAINNLKLDVADLNSGLMPAKSRNNKVYITTEDEQFIKKACEILGLEEDCDNTFKYLVASDDLFAELKK